MPYPTWPMEQARPTAPLRLRRSLLPRLPIPVELISSGIVWALLQATVVIAMLLLVSGAGRPVMTLQGRGDPASAHAVDVLIGRDVTASGEPADLLAAVPADYMSVMGYHPVVIDMNGAPSLAKPNGTCSSPVHLAFDMEPTCRGHDLGYDLLRYAAAIGAPLGVWARPLIDDWWYAAMHQRCDLLQAGASGLACHGQVLATEAIISVNSWREGNGPPIEENPWRYLGALVLLPLTLLAGVRFRRGDPLHPMGRLQTAPSVSVLAG